MKNNEWKNVRLKEIANITMGQSPKSSYYNEEGVGMPFMQGRTTFGEKYHTIERYTTKVTRLANKNSVLMSVRAPVGDVNIAVCDLCIGRGLASLEMKNGNNEFLYYLLKANHEYINSGVSGTVFSSINKSGVEELEFNIPDDKTQRKISSILTSIDSKIEINNQINEKLEETAKALYKEWFVNFNFPDENGLPYKDNGGEFYETELGEIPIGWEVTELKNISEIQTGYAFKSKDYKDDGIKVIRTLNILENGFIDNNNLVYLPKDFYNNSKYEKQKLFLYDTLLVMVGATIGKIGLITQRNLPALQNQNLWRFRPINNVVGNLYLYHVIRQCASNAMGWATGSARQFFQKSQFEKINIILPENEVLMKFEQICSSFYNYISNNLMENEYLNNCKTLLLNKLMSGQIDVDGLNIDWDKLDKTLKEVE